MDNTWHWSDKGRGSFTLAVFVAILVALALLASGCPFWPPPCPPCPPTPTPGLVPSPVPPTAAPTATSTPEPTMAPTVAPTATQGPEPPPEACPGEWDLCLDLTDPDGLPSNSRAVNGTWEDYGFRLSDSGVDLVVPVGMRSWLEIEFRMVLWGLLNPEGRQRRTHLMGIGTYCMAAYTNPTDRWPNGCHREDWAVLELLRFGPDAPNVNIRGDVCLRQENGASEPDGGCCCGRVGCKKNYGDQWDPTGWQIIEGTFICDKLTMMTDTCIWIGGVGHGPRLKGWSGIVVRSLAVRFK